MKSRDTFGPMGPYSSPADEVPLPASCQIPAVGERRAQQDFKHGDIGAQVPRCIEWVSAIHGSIQATCSPPAPTTGASPRSQDGDRIELEVEGTRASARVKVRDALKRTWGRDTRLEHEQKGLPGRTPQLSGKYARIRSDRLARQPAARLLKWRPR